MTLRRHSVYCVHSVLISACLLFAGCARRGTPVERGIRDQVLYRSLSVEPPDLDPQLVTSLPGINVSSALFEGLVSEDPVDLHPVPGVAESWEVSPDGLDYVFHLRADARWSNGEPVTAQDFVASVHRVLTPSLGVENVAFVFPLHNAEAFYRGKMTDFSAVGIAAPDARTLRLRLAHPSPYFLSLLTQPVWAPVRLPAIEKCGPADQPSNRWARPGTFVGNGPFVLREWNPGSLILAEKSPTYWDAVHVRLHAIRFVPAASVDTEERAFRGGQLHITEALPVAKLETYQREQNPALQITPFLDTYFYRLNVTDPVLRDGRIRRALSLALDREALAHTVLHGRQQPAASFTPPGCANGYAPPTLATSDPAAARALLAEAGFPGGQGLPPLELMFNISGNHQIIAEAAQAMWRKELGLDVRLVTMENSSALERRRRLAFQILRSDWAAEYADPKAFLEIFASGSENNHTGWKNSDYDSLLAEADRIADATQRFVLLQRAESILLADAPVIPVYFQTTVRLVHPAVRGWNPTPLDHHPYKYVWLEAQK